MMLDTIVAALSGLPGISDWRLTEKRRLGAEAFFIRDRLDLARAVDALDYRLSVCVDGPEAAGPGATGPDATAGRRRGEASVSIHPTMSGSEIRAAAQRALFAASKALNPWYPLPEAGEAPRLPGSGFSGRSPEAWLGELRDALYSARSGGDGREGAGRARINSLELFLTRTDTRMRNSRGLDAAWEGWKAYVEYTVEAASPEGPVELTDFISLSEPDLPALAAEIRGRLDLVADRAVARPTPAGLDLPLILTGKEAAEVLGYWWGNLNASRVYSRTSPLALGAALHGESARPGDFDPIEITAEATLPGAPESCPRDTEGSALERLCLSPGGQVSGLTGLLRHTHYLGLPEVGNHPLFSVAPGSLASRELRSRPHLEVAFFSDFGVDLDTGDFGAEIRLAYVSDGRASYPVTGGSVSGNLGENAPRLRLARETRLSGTMLGPEAMLLPRVSITGAGGG